MEPEIEDPRDEEQPDGWEYSIADYVRIEADSELVKHEFDNGQIRAADGSWPEPVRYASGERAKLHSIGCEIDVDKLYVDPRRKPAASSEPS